MSKLTQSPAWAALAAHHARMSSVHMRELFAQDPDRFTKLSREAAGVFVDFSKHRVTEETLGLLFALAKQQDVETWRDKMFAGDKINGTEGRSVLHVAARRTRTIRASPREDAKLTERCATAAGPAPPHALTTSSTRIGARTWAGWHRGARRTVIGDDVHLVRTRRHAHRGDPEASIRAPCSSREQDVH